MPAALAVLAVALLLVWLATRRARARSAAFRAGAAHTQAEITDIRWKTVGPLPDRDRLAYPMLRFALPDGSLIETRSEVATAPACEVGDRVEILYLPDEPRRARVADLNRR
jgi:hypothetical protein